MAALRTTWKGHLKLSLVSCPVRLYNATSRSERVSFNLLHKETHNRIQMFPHDPELGKVDRGDLVKGYEYEKDQYVILEQEDFDKVEIESTKTIAIEKFVDASALDPVYFDSPYYLAPDGPVAEETFIVLREAMKQKKKVALSRIVLSGRERLIAITVKDKGFMVMTLRAANEVRDAKPYFEDIDDAKPEKEMLDLAGQLIDQKSGPFDPADFVDRYNEAVIELVKAKVKGRAPVIAKAPERGKVINLMDALKRSLGDGETQKPPAKSRGRAASGEGKKASASGGAKKTSSSRAKSGTSRQKQAKAS
ncbi:MAG: Ku protein [Geminicoccaceae bacterium]|nr:Ku protein [Geminicoccaceae bacterium]